MLRKTTYLLLFALLCSFALPVGLAAADDPGAPPEFTPPTEAVQRQLNAPLSRQATINALLADTKTKSEVLQAAGKLGITESQLRSAPLRPLPFKMEAKPLSDPDEEAFKALNWNNGFWFRPNTIPTYGPKKYKLGALELFPCKINSSYMNYYYLQLQGASSWPYAAVLHLELPSTPALYVVSIRISRTNGPAYPGWINKKPGATVAPAMCYFMNYYPSGMLYVPVSLTPIPGGSGYVGIISSNPTGESIANIMGMRKLNARIRLALYPSATVPSEPMSNLIFHSFHISRL